MNISGFIKTTISELYKSSRRFPVPIALSTFVAVMLITISETQLRSGYDSTIIDTLSRITMVIALGIPLSLCIKLIFEKNLEFKPYLKIFTYIISGCALVLYYFFLLKDFEMVAITRYIALNFALYLCFLFIPYMDRRENFELYIIKLISRFFITVVYALVLFLGLVAILFTIDKLLEVYIHEKLYLYTWIIIACIFSTIYFLAGVPESSESLEDYKYPGFFKILLLYIVMPLLSIYLTILYIYFAKIIITRVWPVGLVSHLVLWYSALCAAVIFLITPLKSNAWVNKFVFFLPKLILPILIMMFISMGIRINAYGVTESRYFVIILGLWVFGIMLYISIKKVPRNIILPITLSLLAIISVFGPLSSFTISKLSQNSRLSAILSRNQMLSENRTIKSKSDISERDKMEISSILDYFETNHKLSDVKYLGKDFAIADMKKVFGFNYKEQVPYGRNEKYYSYNANLSQEPIDIKDYDYFFDMRSYKNISASGDLKVQYLQEDGEVNIYSGKNKLYNLKIAKLVEKLRSQYPNDSSVDQKDMIISDETQNIKVKFIFSNIYGNGSASDEDIKVDNAEFYVLLKLK